MAPRKDYTPKQMGDAIAAVEAGSPVATAAKRFGVPRITLYNKTSGKSPAVCKMGPTTVLTESEEDLLVKWLLAAAQRRFPVSKEHLLDSVQRIVTEQHRETPFTGNRPGKKWFAAFLKRHPIIAERTSENLTTARNNVTEEQIIKWFTEIEEYLTNLDLHQALNDPNRIFNTDESAFFLSPKPGRVLAKKGEKHIYTASGDDKENLTVLVTANAAGKLAPPMIVYAYERIPANIAKSVPEDWGIGKSESGWMCGETFYEYISTVFNPWLIQQNIPKPILFFLDGHRSHMTLHLSQFCSANGIEIIALFPNSTHILQPMDIAVFRPLKVYFRKEVIQWKMENSGNKLKKENFAPVFKKALNQITPDCIKNSFRGGGLHPFGPEYIDMSKLRVQNPVVQDPNELEDEKTRQALTFLESKIIKIFGKHKLDMYSKLYFESRNVIENMALEEDQNLYILWAYIKGSQSICTSHDVISHSNMEASSTPSEMQAPDSDQNSNANLIITGQTHTSLDVIPPSNMSTSEMQANDTDLNSISNEINTEKNHTSYDCIAFKNTETSSEIQDEDTNLGSNANIIITRQNLLNESTASTSYDTLDKALGVIVPSPFKSCLFWPETVRTKKFTKKKEKIPSAVTSKAWQQYHEKKEAEKKRILEVKELKAKQRLEKKELKEKLAQEKREKIKAKKKKKDEMSSSDDTETEIEYKESEESELNEECDSDNTLCERRIPNLTPERKYLFSSGQRNEKAKKNLEKGSFVIIKYEGQYFPGRIENIDDRQFEINTMKHATGNTFKWPDRPDKIWYNISDIIETIRPPSKHNNRGYFKVAEMEKFLPDLYLT